LKPGVSIEQARAEMTRFRRFFGKSLGRSVGDFKTTDAIGDANRSQTADTGIGIRREAGSLLVAGIYDRKFAFREQVIEAKHVVSRQTEDMPHAMSIKSLDEIAADGERSFHLAD